MRSVSMAILGLGWMVTSILAPAVWAETAAEPKSWPDGKTFELKGMKVTLSAPVLVRRDREPYYFPKIARLPNGEIMLHSSVFAPLDLSKVDDNFLPERAEVLWSSDGGLTWKDPQNIPDGSSLHVLLPNGDMLLAPYRTFELPKGDGLKGPLYLIPKGKHEVKTFKEGFTVTGFPRPLGRSDDQKKAGQAGWALDGAPDVMLKNGGYLATVSGWFAQKDKKSIGQAWSNSVRTSLAAIESRDGLHWQVKSVISDENSGLPGKEGAGEASLVRLKDGRIMVIFRQEGYNTAYAQAWSSDEGLTWTKPVSCSDAYGVQPRVDKFQDGSLILIGGRPDIHVWFNADGAGKDWQKIDLLEHHNTFEPQNPIQRNHDSLYYPFGMSSCNSEVVCLDGHTALVTYDKTPKTTSYQNTRGPKDTTNPDEMYSVWVVKVTVGNK